MEEKKFFRFLKPEQRRHPRKPNRLKATLFVSHYLLSTPSGDLRLTQNSLSACTSVADNWTKGLNRPPFTLSPAKARKETTPVRIFHRDEPGSKHGVLRLPNCASVPLFASYY